MVKVQRLFAKTNLKIPVCCNLRSRVWGSARPNKKLSQRGKNFSGIENLWPRDGSCPLRFSERIERTKMIQKHELPILEYDSNSEEVIRPNHGAEQLVLPEKCVFGFLGDVIDDYAFEMDAVIAEHFETITKSYPIYIVRQNGLEFCLCQAPLGAAAAAQLLDFLISCGCKKIISTGSCGVLTDLAENEFLIPIKALRDEGTSYHYLPASRYIELDKNILDAIEHTLLVQNIPFRECVTWTTDGFFRETQDMVRYRRAEGCTTVEMECAALAACARKRGASFGQILYTADSLANVSAHDERDWGKGSLRKALELCISVLINI